jgi:hypothetical protein
VKPLAVPADAERVVIDLLTATLIDRGQDVTVGVIVPTTWTPATKPHVQVALDGTPEVDYPVLWRATIRVTCWASSTTTAKTLAYLALSLLASHEGSGGVYSIRALTGVLPTRDPDTDAEMASVTVEVNLRGIVLT